MTWSLTTKAITLRVAFGSLFLNLFFFTVALVALENSPIFSLDLQLAQSCFTELEYQGLIVGVNITSKGKNLIRQSPYSAYAEALTA